MSFKSILSAIGHDFVATFKFLGSQQGQNDINATENIVNIIVSKVNPLAAIVIQGTEALINAGIRKVADIEAGAAAVGAQSGTGAQKLEAFAAYLTPQTGAFLQSVGVSNPTADQINKLATAIGSSVVTILNTIPAPSAPVAPTTLALPVIAPGTTTSPE